MQFFKNIYMPLWKSEYSIFLIDNEYYLVVNTKTNFDILGKEKFEKLGDKLIYPLAWLCNYHITPEDIVDIVCYNNVLCYVVKSKIANRYHLLPATGRSGMDVDNKYMLIGNWGEPTFIQIFCPICNHIFYFDTLKLPHGEIYETKCTKCGFIAKRKNK